VQEVRERERKAHGAVKTIDVSQEQCLFCPFCRGTNVELVDESAATFVCNLEEWLCRDCRGYFLVETRRFVTYEEVSEHVG